MMVIGSVFYISVNLALAFCSFSALSNVMSEIRFCAFPILSDLVRALAGVNGLIGLCGSVSRSS